jgi:Glycosyl hydrolases family 16
VSVRQFAVVEGYEVEIDDTFEGPELDREVWLPHHLPHWSSWSASAARYRLGDGGLRLVVEADQPPWCPEFDGQVRVSSLQTAVQSGQHRFSPSAVVREAVPPQRLYTPQYGFFEIRMRVSDDPSSMAALWMIGLEDRPERSAEICIAEIFGRDVGRERSAVGMGVHPFGDPTLTDEFAAVPLPIDATALHEYAAEWTPERVRFLVDGAQVRQVEQSPGYPMQFMLGVYAFPAADGGPPPGPYPKEFVVDLFRGYRPSGAARR